MSKFKFTEGMTLRRNLQNFQTRTLVSLVESISNRFYFFRANFEKHQQYVVTASLLAKRTFDFAYAFSASKKTPISFIKLRCIVS